MSNITNILKAQRNLLASGKTLDVGFRMTQLSNLRASIQAYEREILTALKNDLNKAPFEGYAAEVGLVLEEIRYTLKHLKQWSKPQKVKTPLINFPAKSFIYSEPYGISLIMSPWNYPFQLSIVPLIGSIAAGNCTVLKSSSYSAHTSALLAKIIQETFDENYVIAIQGGREANKALLDEKFDHIFFTGSVEVGKKVMQAAARYLTPITLELGGKSPCIVDEDANWELAAKRITWGKFLNSGQTCVAPDYLLVQRKIKNNLLEKIQKYIKEFFGENPLNNPDLPKIINMKQFEKLLGFLSAGQILCGGIFDREKLLIAPTLLDQVQWQDAVMQEEIFGPILPVIEFDSLEEVIQRVNSLPKPLACYYFTQSKKKEEQIIRQIPFGGGCINDTVIHVASPYLPFGGVGESGLGSYHGKTSFDTFSNQKSIIKQSRKFDIPIRYPPYKEKINFLRRIMG